MTEPRIANIYHRILKLPEHIIAPDAYQLLGISRFEPDLKIIKRAAMDRNALLQRMQNAENYEAVKRLEREVGEAMVRLTNPKQKAEYDQTLTAIVLLMEPSPTSGISNGDLRTKVEQTPRADAKKALPGEAPWLSPAAWWKSRSSILKGIVIGLSVASLLGFLFYSSK